MKRRRFLKLGAVGTAVSFTGTAGCVGFLGSSGSNINNWLPAPRTLDTDVERYTFNIDSPATLEGKKEQFNGEDWNNYVDILREEYGSPRVSEVDNRIGVFGSELGWSYSVLEHNVDLEIVERDIQEDDYRFALEHEGYDIYEKENDEVEAVAVQDGTLIRGSARGGITEDGETLLISTIDTSEGMVETYTEARPIVDKILGEINKDYSYFVSMQEPPEEMNVEEGEFTGNVGAGIGINIHDRETVVKIVLGFETDQDIFERDLEDWTREDDFFDGDLRDIEVSKSGQIGAIKGTIPTRKVLENGSPL